MDSTGSNMQFGFNVQIDSLRQQLQDAIQAFQEAGAQMQGALPTTLGQGMTDGLSAGAQQAVDSLQQVSDAAGALQSSIGDTGNASQVAAQGIADMADSLATAIQNGASASDVSDMLAGVGSSATDAADAVDGLASSVSDARDAMAGIGTQASESMDALAGSAGNAADAVQGLTTSAQDAKDATASIGAQAAESLQQMGDSAQEVAEDVHGIREAGEEVEEQVERMSTMEAWERLQSSARELTDGFVELGKEAVADAEHFEEMQGRLTAAFQGTGRDVGEVANQIKELGLNSNFTDDQLGQAAITLQKFGQYSQATMEQVTDLAAKTGESVGMVANIWGRFLQGDTRSLLMLQRQLGITGATLQQFGAHVDANGKILAKSKEDIAAASEAMQRYAESTAVKGAAEAQMTALQKLNKAWEDYQLQAGTAGAGLQDLLAGPLTGMLNWLTQVHPGLVQVTGGLEAFGGWALDAGDKILQTSANIAEFAMSLKILQARRQADAAAALLEGDAAEKSSMQGVAGTEAQTTAIGEKTAAQEVATGAAEATATAETTGADAAIAAIDAEIAAIEAKTAAQEAAAVAAAGTGTAEVGAAGAGAGAGIAGAGAAAAGAGAAAETASAGFLGLNLSIGAAAKAAGAFIVANGPMIALIGGLVAAGGLLNDFFLQNIQIQKDLGEQYDKASQQVAGFQREISGDWADKSSAQLNDMGVKVSDLNHALDGVNRMIVEVAANSDLDAATKKRLEASYNADAQAIVKARDGLTTYNATLAANTQAASDATDKVTTLQAAEQAGTATREQIIQAMQAQVAAQQALVAAEEEGAQKEKDQATLLSEQAALRKEEAAQMEQAAAQQQAIQKQSLKDEQSIDDERLKEAKAAAKARAQAAIEGTNDEIAANKRAQQLIAAEEKNDYAQELAGDKDFAAQKAALAQNEFALEEKLIIEKRNLAIQEAQSEEQLAVKAIQQKAALAQEEYASQANLYAKLHQAGLLNATQDMEMQQKVSIARMTAASQAQLADLQIQAANEKMNATIQAADNTANEAWQNLQNQRAIAAENEKAAETAAAKKAAAEQIKVLQDQSDQEKTLLADSVAMAKMTADQKLDLVKSYVQNTVQLYQQQGQQEVEADREAEAQLLESATLTEEQKDQIRREFNAKAIEDQRDTTNKIVGFLKSMEGQYANLYGPTLKGMLDQFTTSQRTLNDETERAVSTTSGAIPVVTSYGQKLDDAARSAQSLNTALQTNQGTVAADTGAIQANTGAVQANTQARQSNAAAPPPAAPPATGGGATATPPAATSTTPAPAATNYGTNADGSAIAGGDTGTYGAISPGEGGVVQNYFGAPPQPGASGSGGFAHGGMNFSMAGNSIPSGIGGAGGGGHAVGGTGGPTFDQGNVHQIAGAPPGVMGPPGQGWSPITGFTGPGISFFGEGGLVGDGGGPPTSGDTVPAWLDPRELVVPPERVGAVLKAFPDLNRPGGGSQGGMQHFAAGGVVDPSALINAEDNGLVKTMASNTGLTAQMSAQQMPAMVEALHGILDVQKQTFALLNDMGARGAPFSGAGGGRAASPASVQAPAPGTTEIIDGVTWTLAGSGGNLYWYSAFGGTQPYTGPPAGAPPTTGVSGGSPAPSSGGGTAAGVASGSTSAGAMGGAGSAGNPAQPTVNIGEQFARDAQGDLLLMGASSPTSMFNDLTGGSSGAGYYTPTGTGTNLGSNDSSGIYSSSPTTGSVNLAAGGYTTVAGNWVADSHGNYYNTVTGETWQYYSMAGEGVAPKWVNSRTGEQTTTDPSALLVANTQTATAYTGSGVKPVQVLPGSIGANGSLTPSAGQTPAPDPRAALTSAYTSHMPSLDYSAIGAIA